MNAKILKFTGKKIKPRKGAVKSFRAEVIQFPESARPSLTRIIASDVCHF